MTPDKRRQLAQDALQSALSKIATEYGISVQADTEVRKFGSQVQVTPVLKLELIAEWEQPSLPGLDTGGNQRL